MYNPYSKGRWYRFFVESDGSAITITEKDLEGQISANYLQMPKDFHVIDTKYDVHTVAGGSAGNMQYVLRIYNDSSQAVELPAVDHFDYAYIYVFGYFS